MIALFAHALVVHGTLPSEMGSASKCFIDPVWGASEVYHDRNHAYGSAFNAETNMTQTLVMDFYAPPTIGPRADKRLKRPSVVLIHGGSFISGDKSSWAPLATVLAQRGFVVGSVNYRLTGRHWGVADYCCPGNLSDQYAVDAVHDLRAAVRYLRKMADGDAWRLDADRIGIGGGSAGAVTVAFYGYAKDAQGEGTSGNAGFRSDVKFVMPVSGELAYDAFCQGGIDPAGNPLGCHYGSWNWTDQIDGAKHNPVQPPLLSVHGTHDSVVPIREAHQMQARAAATGLKHELIAIPGAGHVPQAELINGSTPYLGMMLQSIYAYMELADAECPKFF